MRASLRRSWCRSGRAGDRAWDNYSPMPLDLLVPDLLLPQDAPAAMRALRLPELEKWLARADIETAAGTRAMHWLGAAVDLANPPVAATARSAGGAARDGPRM